MSDTEKKKYYGFAYDSSQTVSVTIEVPVKHWERFCDDALSYGYDGRDFLVLSLIFDSGTTPNFKKLKVWKMIKAGLISDETAQDKN